MRAVICSAFGPPESLVVDEVDSPEVGDHQVLIDVHVCAVNFPDVLMVQGLYQFEPPFPFIPGAEVAGVISAVGRDVGSLRVGDRVLGTPHNGGMAEQVAVNADSVVVIGNDIDFVRAAGFGYAYGTSYHALKDRGHLKKGETLVVLGAAGGVGLAAVELGAAVGATVIAVASTQEKLGLCLEHGASSGINYVTEDLRSRIRELTDDRGVDVVYDAVGGPSSETALRCLVPGGRFLVVGFASGEIPKIPLNLVLLKNCDIVGVFWGSFARTEAVQNLQNFNELLVLWRDGKLHPHVSSSYPLERAPEALRELADRRALGKVVVQVRPSEPT